MSGELNNDLENDCNANRNRKIPKEGTLRCTEGRESKIGKYKDKEGNKTKKKKW